MVFDWNLVGKCWTAQYDKDMMLDELSSRFREGFQLRKPPGVAARGDISSAGRACGDTNAAYHEIPTAIAEGGDTIRKWRCWYEEWQLHRNDLGWKTKKTSLRKKNMGESINDGLPNLGVSNRFHALSCETEDNCHAESEIADDPEMPSMVRASVRSRHQHSSANVAAGRDSVQRSKKSGIKSKGAAACIATKYRPKGGGCLSGRPQMYMFKQVPQGFEDTWRDSNKREKNRGLHMEGKLSNESSRRNMKNGTT